MNFNAIIKYPIGTKIPSINQMYLTRRGGGRYLNPEVANHKLHIKTQIIKQGMSDYFKDKKDIAIELEILVIFKTRFWVRDVSNIIKATEDAIAEVIKVDDKYNVRVSTRKILNDKDDHEYLIIVAKDIPRDSPIIKWSTIDVNN